MSVRSRSEHGVRGKLAAEMEHLIIELKLLGKSKKQSMSHMRRVYAMRKAKVEELHELIVRKLQEQKQIKNRKRKRHHKSRTRRLYMHLVNQLKQAMRQEQLVLDDHKAKHQKLKLGLRNLKKLAQRSPQTWCYFRSYIQRLELAFDGVLPMKQAGQNLPPYLSVLAAPDRPKSKKKKFKKVERVAPDVKDILRQLKCAEELSKRKQLTVDLPKEPSITRITVPGPYHVPPRRSQSAAATERPKFQRTPRIRKKLRPIKPQLTDPETYCEPEKPIMERSRRLMRRANRNKSKIRSKTNLSSTLLQSSEHLLGEMKPKRKKVKRFQKTKKELLKLQRSITSVDSATILPDLAKMKVMQNKENLLPKSEGILRSKDRVIVYPHGTKKQTQMQHANSDQGLIEMSSVTLFTRPKRMPRKKCMGNIVVKDSMMSFVSRSSSNDTIDPPPISPDIAAQMPLNENAIHKEHLKFFSHLTQGLELLKILRQRAEKGGGDGDADRLDLASLISYAAFSDHNSAEGADGNISEPGDSAADDKTAPKQMEQKFRRPSMRLSDERSKRIIAEQQKTIEELQHKLWKIKYERQVSSVEDKGENQELPEMQEHFKDSWLVRPAAIKSKKQSAKLRARRELREVRELWESQRRDKQPKEKQPIDGQVLFLNDLDSGALDRELTSLVGGNIADCRPQDNSDDMQLMDEYSRTPAKFNATLNKLYDIRVLATDTNYERSLIETDFERTKRRLCDRQRQIRIKPSSSRRSPAAVTSYDADSNQKELIMPPRFYDMESLRNYWRKYFAHQQKTPTQLMLQRRRHEKALNRAQQQRQQLIREERQRQRYFQRSGSRQHCERRLERQHSLRTTEASLNVTAAGFTAPSLRKGCSVCEVCGMSNCTSSGSDDAAPDADSDQEQSIDHFNYLRLPL